MANTPLRFKNENVFDGAVAVACAKHGVSPALLKGIIGHESQFNAHAQALGGGDGRRGGSYGLAQMSLATARIFDPAVTSASLLIPAVNLDIAARYVSDLLAAAARGGYGLDSAVSAYNAGNSPYRPGDGPRVGVNAATPAVARTHPFTNQPYVDAVLSNVRYFMARGAGTANAAYDAHATGPGGLGAAGAVLGLVVAVALFAMRR